jgi:hypothetical protein
VRRAHAQVLPIERLDDFDSEDGLELLNIRVLAPKVAEDVSAPAHHFQLFVLHRNISFSLFRRTLIDLNAWTTQISAASCTA